MQEDKRFMPKKGYICSIACEFAFACINHKEGEICQGFQMLNGESARIIRHNLGEDNLKYMKNSYNFIQRSMDNGDIEAAQTIHKDIARFRDQSLEKPTPMKHDTSQFQTFLKISDQSSTQSPSNNSRKVTQDFGSGFRAMLNAATSKKHESDTLEKRHISISPLKPSRPKPLHVKTGFRQMLEEATRGSDVVENERSIRKATVYRSFRSWGFRDMLDFVSPSDSHATLVVRGSAEKNVERLEKLLENVGKPKPNIERSMSRHEGFRRMLDAISPDS